jgi:hypothetical protein
MQYTASGAEVLPAVAESPGVGERPTASRTARGFCIMMVAVFVSDIGAWGTKMAKKITRSRPWAKEELRMLKTPARENEDNGDRTEA